jgi:hypothetical protein
MKTTPYTLALIGAGLVSLPAVMHAEEKITALQTMISSTTLSGYVDTSAQWNPGTGNDNLPPYKFGGASKADGFNLNVVQLRLDKPLDEASWAAGYRVDMWLGPDANGLGTASTFHTATDEGGSADFALRQAYVALRAPVGNGIDVKIGVFDSVIGYESVESPSNPNFTRSYGHSLEPQTHTGLLASYRFSDCVSVSGGIANTKGPVINARGFGEDGKAESHKTYMGSLALTAPESWGFLSGSTLYAGVVSGLDDNEVGPDYDENSTSYYVGATIATPITGVRLGAAFDYLDVRHFSSISGSGHPGNAWSVAGYVSWQATEKLSLHARGEYLDDRADFFSFASGESSFDAGSGFRAIELTGTIQYDLWKNVLTRVECRWDHGTNGKFFGSSTVNEEPVGFQRNAVALIANVVYKF